MKRYYLKTITLFLLLLSFLAYSEVYIVKKDDTLSNIALNHLGTPIYGIDDFVVSTPIVSTQVINITMSGWFYSTRTAGSTNELLFYNGNAGSSGYGLLISDGSCGFGNKINLLIGGLNCDALSSTAVMPNNSWTYLTLTRENTTWKLYINGVFSKSSTVDPATPTGEAYIGGGITGGSFFSGYIDDVAFWNTALTADEVQTIYNRQSAKYSGVFTSRVMDNKLETAWTGLSWLTTLPFGKELPDNTSSESSSNYSLLTTDTLMNGNIALWHFNEGSGANVLKDSSNNGNDLTTFFGPSTIDVDGKFGRGVKFINSQQTYISSAWSDFGPLTEFTVSAWIKHPENIISENNLEM